MPNDDTLTASRAALLDAAKQYAIVACTPMRATPLYSKFNQPFIRGTLDCEVVVKFAPTGEALHAAVVIVSKTGLRRDIA